MDRPPAPTTGRVAFGRKVGRKPAFTAEEAVAAALAEGIDRFTLSAVADRLGVVTAALYRVFPSRDDLVIACLDVAAGSLRRPAPGTDWRSALRLWADECWLVCENHPGLELLVYSYAPAFTRVGEVLAEYTSCITADGRTKGQAVFALDFIGDTVFASHLGVTAMRDMDDHGRRGLDQVREVLDPDSVLQPSEAWTGRSIIDTKIEFIITGLEHHWPEL